MDMGLGVIALGALGFAFAWGSLLRVGRDLGLATGLIVFTALAFYTSAAFGLKPIWFWQVVYILVSLAGWGFLLWSIRRNTPEILSATLKNKDLWAAVLIFSGLLLFWLYQFRDLAGLPSSADGIHHAYFLWRMLETGELFSGRMTRLWPELFGAEHLHFYPTGAHYLAAIIGAPAWFFFKTPPYEILRSITLLTLSAFPVFLFLGSRRLFPEIPRAIPLGAAALFGLWYLFPGDVLGEGGYSRLLGCTLAIPLAIGLLEKPRQPKTLFVAAALGLPSFLIIHPQALFIFGPALLWAALASAPPRVRNILALSAGGALAGGFTLLLLKTGAQMITSPEVVTHFGHDFPLSAGSLFERGKALIHYWFADRSGPGKFLSPQSLLLWLGLVAAWRARGRKSFFAVHLLGVFLLPFLVFFPGEIFQKINMLFYQQNKRMAELGFFPLFFLIQFGAVWILAGVRRTGKSTVFSAAKYALAGLAILWTGVSAQKLDRNFDHLKTLYDSPRRMEIQALREKIRRLPREQAILITHVPHSLVMTGVPNPALSLHPECPDPVVTPPSSACLARMARVEELKRCLGQNKETFECWPGGVVSLSDAESF